MAAGGRAKIGKAGDRFHFFQDDSGQWWYQMPRQKLRAESRVCPNCGDAFPARKATKVKWCSATCSNRDRTKVERGKQTKLEKYGSKAGARYTDDHGYIRLYLPGYIGAQNGCIPEHRWVMEQHLGRKLLPEETVHHKNGIRDDNRLENLELWCSDHPSGQRVEDIVAWAAEVLAKYKSDGDTLEAGDKVIRVELKA